MIDDYVKNWIIKAYEDYKIAAHELKLSEEEMVKSAVCFHCQQFVEKILKAYLILNEIKFGRTHDLKVLLELCIKKDNDFSQINVGNLTSYATNIRYADEFYMPSVKEAKESFEIARNVKEFVFKKLGIKEEEIL
jgi:HEPN domain-containing protein